MADVKITALTAIGANPVNPATFPIPMVDLLDNLITASGTTKKVTVNQILGSGGTATLASATITGAATVGTTLGVTGASTLASATITGDLTVDTSTLKVVSSTDRVGIGTASPGKRCEINQSANAITTIGSGEILRLIGDDGNTNSRITEVGFGAGPTGATFAPVIVGAVNTSISSYGTKDFYVATRAGTSDVAPLERYRIDSTGISTWSVAGTTAMTLNASGLGLGTATFGTSAAKVLAIGTGTEPTTGPAGTVQLFTSTRSASNTIPAIFTEGSGVTNAAITNTTVTNKIAIKVNGTIYYLLATTSAA